MSGILTFLTGRNLPKISQPRHGAPPIMTEQAIRDFTRVVEQERIARQSREIKDEIARLDRLFGE